MKDGKYNVLILFGGVSSEHEISRKSAASVIKRLNKDKYNVYKAGITKDGEWMLTDAPAEYIESGKWEKSSGNKKTSISADRTVHGMYIFEKDGSVAEKRIDAVFPVLHGRNGEDGTMQGLLEMAGIPFVGCGCMASANGMDKATAKLIVKAAGIAQADAYITNRYDFSERPTETLKEVMDYFDGQFPLFVKPASAGSSVGVSRVIDFDSLFEGVKAALNEDHKVLIEEAVIGREMEVAVLGNRNLRVSKIGEVFSANDFYDYEAKYRNNATKTRIVDNLDEQKFFEIQQAAVAVYKALGCRGLSRVDFFLKTDGTVVFNEINTLPGFTSKSMYPRLWEATGLPYDELLDQLFMLAMDEME